MVYFKYIPSTIISQYKKQNKLRFIDLIQQIIKISQLKFTSLNKRPTFYVSHSLAHRPANIMYSLKETESMEE